MKISEYGIELTDNEPKLKFEIEVHNELKLIFDGLKKSKSYCKNYSSYRLKHIFEKFLAEKTKGQISYISNGQLIKSFQLEGYDMKRVSKNSRNVFFKIDPLSLKTFRKFV